MRFSILASGSTGNAIYVETEEVRLLIDAGFSGKQIEALMAVHGLHPSLLHAVLVTHEHIDHVKGIGVLARKYNLPIYANEGTWGNMPNSVGEIPESCRYAFETGKSFALGDLDLQSFPTSHDAGEPVGFRIVHGDSLLAIATDLGYVSDKQSRLLAEADMLILEANHDVEMLRMGSYPWELKRRILSDVGHLSNQACGEALLEILPGRVRHVFLAHLSQDNNLPELARLTVEQLLQEEGVEVGREVVLHHTSPSRPLPLMEVAPPRRLREVK